MSSSRLQSVYPPDDTVNVPAPDTVEIVNEEFVPIVSVVFNEMDSVPAPDIAVKPKVTDEAAVRVKVELTSIFPVPFVIFVTRV